MDNSSHVLLFVGMVVECEMSVKDGTMMVICFTMLQSYNDGKWVHDGQ